MKKKKKATAKITVVDYIKAIKKADRKTNYLTLQGGNV